MNTWVAAGLWAVSGFPLQPNVDAELADYFFGVKEVRHANAICHFEPVFTGNIAEELILPSPLLNCREGEVLRRARGDGSLDRYECRCQAEK